MPVHKLWTLLVVIMCEVLGFHSETRPATLQEFCDTDVFKPNCAENEVIVMQTAKYGRMRLGKCVEIDLGYIGCFTDVLDLTDKRCSGRRTCEIRVPDADFEGTRPCLKELKTYLEASYTCVPVTMGTTDDCALADYVNITSPYGWIASVVTQETGCGTVSHPWVINVPKGQRINVTLYDFSPEKRYRTNQLEYEVDTHVCREYALIQEVSTEWNSVVCGGGKRIQNVYSSKSNSLEIQITNKDKRQFLLYYEAIGCSDLVPPHYGYFEREEKGAVVGCLHSKHKWHITCSGTTWVGFVGNCTARKYTTQAVPMEEHNKYDLNLPLGASIAIIIGAAIGVGLVVVVIGLIRFRSFFFTRTRREYDTPPHPMETIMLREKSPPPESFTQDSGHCSIDTATDTDTPPPRTIRHQRIVKINGNEYAHIWESPLPEPIPPDVTACRLCPRDPRDPMNLGMNAVYMYRYKPPVDNSQLCNTLNTLKETSQQRQLQQQQQHPQQLQPPPQQPQPLQSPQTVRQGKCSPSHGGAPSTSGASGSPGGPSEAPRYSTFDRKDLGNSSSV